MTIEVDERDYDAAFEIISYAGTSKGLAAEAIRQAAEGEYEEAARMMAEAQEALNKAHDCLFALVTKEAQGQGAPLNLLLVHAQDHLVMATTMGEQARLALDLYRRIGEGKAAETGEIRENRAML